MANEMNISITKTSDGRTHIKASHTKFTIGERYLELLPPDGGESILSGSPQGGFVSVKIEFDIEDEGMWQRFIKPYPNQTTGEFTVRMWFKKAYTVEGQDPWSVSETQTCTYTIYENDYTKPTINNISILPTTTFFNDTTIFLQGKNGVKTTFSSLAKFGATITEAYWYILPETTYASGYSSPNIITTGTVKLYIVAKDTRGFVNTIEQNITVLPYYKPSIAPISGEVSVIARRVDENGNVNEAGTKIQLKVKKSYASVNGKNSCTLKYRIRTSKGGAWGSYLEISTDANGEHLDVIAGSYDKALDYYIELYVVDSFDESTFIILPIPSEKVYMDRSGARNSIAFGGHVTEDNSFEIYQTTRLYGGLVIKGEDDTLYSLTIENGAIVIK